MATHHVSPRRACPAPKGSGLLRQASKAQQQLWLKRSAPVQSTVVLLPARPIQRGTRKHYWVGKVQNAYPTIFTCGRETGNGPGGMS
jgi:hypothetical protein